jgi:hypothetical protein
MDQVVPFHGTVSWPLFRRAQLKHVGRRWLILFMFPVIMIAWAWWTAGTLGSAWAMVFAGAFAYVPIMIIFSVFGWRRMYKKTPLLHQPLAGTVSSDKFVAESVTGRTEMTWNQFVRIKDGKDLILLYYGPHQFNVLAREFFESDAAWETARNVAMRGSAD